MTSINPFAPSIPEFKVKSSPNAKGLERQVITPIKVSPTATEVVQDIAENINESKVAAAQLQQLTNIITDRKLQFRVNEALGQVVIKIIDPKTDKLVREIPSHDVQSIKTALRKTMGSIFDGEA